MKLIIFDCDGTLVDSQHGIVHSMQHAYGEVGMDFPGRERALSIVGLSLIFTEDNFLEVSGIIILAHIPVMIIEGIVTAVCVAFLRKVRPEMLPGFTG